VSWREERRRDDAARAEQARQDALTAAEVEAIRARTETEAMQEQAAHRAELRQQAKVHREQTRNAARDRRRARWADVRTWAIAHTVDLLIYPLAVVSAVMAVPAMAAFGHEVYGSVAGYALPVITELGMWAFAFAVHHVRHRSERDGQDRPVWALQVGVWAFATVAAGLNLLHGLTATGVQAGVVMAVASVAGVMAHQLVTAAPRRGRHERAADRMARRADRKVTRVRVAVVRASVADIDPHGETRLLFTPGRYRLARSRWTPWRRQRLTPAAVPGLPVTPTIDTPWDALDRELADLLANPLPTDRNGHGSAHDGRGTGSVGTLDRPADQAGDVQESTPDHRSDSAPRSKPRNTRRPRSAPRSRARKPGRTPEELMAELHAAIEADPTSVNPASAESIRKTLRCSPDNARLIRDTYEHPRRRTDHN
jgi:hypothetical protein